MKKFSVRKISALVLVFCLFVSVFANTGIYTARAADEVADGTALVSGADADIVVEDVADAPAASSTDAPAAYVAPAAPAASSTDAPAAPAVSSADAPAAPAASSTDAERKPQIAETIKVEREPVMMMVTAEATGTTATITFNMMSNSSEAWLSKAIVTGYQIVADGSWSSNSWQEASDEYITITNSGTSCSISWNTAEATNIWCSVGGASTSSDWIRFDAGVGHTGSATYNLYLAESGDAFTTTDPNAGSEDDSTDEDVILGTATVTYAGSSTNVWFGSKSYADADGNWGSYSYISSGSNDYITITQSGNTWTVTWDVSKVSIVSATFGAEIDGSYPEVYPNLTDGTALTYYDGADGTLTTEEPTTAETTTATIVYHGTGSIVQIISNGYSDENGWVSDCNTWQTESDDKITFGGSGNTRTLTWNPDEITEIYVIIGGNNANGEYVQNLKVTATADATIDLYDTADGSDFTTEKPAEEEPEDTTTGTATVTYAGDSTNVWFGSKSYADADGNWGSFDWITSGSNDYITITQSGNTWTVTWDTSKVSIVSVTFGAEIDGSYPEVYPNLTDGIALTYYDSADGTLTTEEPTTDDTTDTTATATFIYHGTSDYFALIGNGYSDENGWVSGCNTWQTDSDDKITFGGSGNTKTLTWDPNEITEIYVIVAGNNANGSWVQDLKLTATPGATFHIYDTADGSNFTTENPVESGVGTATITYKGTGTEWWMGLDGAYDVNGEWIAFPGNWLAGPGSNDYVTITLTDNVYTITWDTSVVSGAYAKFGSSAGSWEDEIGDGSNIVIYDDENGLTTENPNTYTASIRYFGTAGDPIIIVNSYVDADGNVVAANSGWWVQSSDENFTFGEGNKSVSWDGTNMKSLNITIGGMINGSWVSNLTVTVTNGTVIDIYDNEDFTNFTTEATELEVPSNYVSATVIYMGNYDFYLGSYGLSPVDSIAPQYGWWINDSAAPNAPVGQYTMCSVSGNSYTFMWDGDLAKQCWIWYNCSGYEDGYYTSLEPGEVVYIYDKDILGRLSYEAPVYSTSTLEIYTDDVNWSGISALCTEDGEWINGLWIDNNNNDYGITVTKTVLDGKTVYTYTWDRTQISTICVEGGVVNNDGTDSKIWINYINGRTRKLYVDEATGNITTFPAGYTYVKPGAGEGIDGTLKVHYIREDGDYSSWYFGYWYELSGEWFSYNEKFDSEGVYALDLIDIPANEIGFVVNYNDWESKDIEEDRFIQLSKLVADENGEYNVYLYSGDATVYYEPKA